MNFLPDLDVRRIPKDLSHRLRGYFRYLYSNRTVDYEAELLRDMPAAMRSELAEYMMTNFIKTASILHPVPPGQALELMPHLKPAAFSPMEVIAEQYDNCSE